MTRIDNLCARIAFDSKQSLRHQPKRRLYKLIRYSLLGVMGYGVWILWKF